MFCYPSLVLSDWSDGSIGAIGLADPQPVGPALHYICEPVLMGWCRQAQWIEEALVEMKNCLEFRLQQVGLQARGRALGGCLISSKLFGTLPFVNSGDSSGHSLWERVCLEDLCLSEDLSLALTEGLTVLGKQAEVNSTSCCSVQ